MLHVLVPCLCLTCFDLLFFLEQNSILSSFQWRFFQLRGFSLLYFKKREMGERSLGTIDVRPTLKILLADQSKNDLPERSLALVMPERIWEFQFDSLSSRAEWLNVLTSVVCFVLLFLGQAEFRDESSCLSRIAHMTAELMLVCCSCHLLRRGFSLSSLAFLFPLPLCLSVDSPLSSWDYGRVIHADVRPRWRNLVGRCSFFVSSSPLLGHLLLSRSPRRWGRKGRDEGEGQSNRRALFSEREASSMIHSVFCLPLAFFVPPCNLPFDSFCSVFPFSCPLSSVAAWNLA